ncbi:MAG TPA: outer membrane beta-barrel protein [Candidatus Eisenbacteria bacterium]|jgi:hypothetical protein
MKRFATTLAALALVVVASQALAAEKSIIIGLGLTHGTADIASSNAIPNYNSAFQTPELGGRLEYWNMMKENYALNFAANIGFSSETDKPRSGAPANSPELKFTTTSYSFRLGGDRVYSPNEYTKMFFGPGIEYWSGKAKFEGFSASTYETENTTRISLHGHMGGMMMIGPNWGLSGQIGHKIGIASYEEKGGKTNWMPSSIDGAMELVFSFGGGK